MESPTTSDNGSPDFELIHDDSHIAALLNTARDRRVPVTICAAGSLLTAPTIILAFDSDQQMIELDEPASHQSLPGPSVELELRMRVDGIPVHFVTRRHTMSQWHVVWPECVEYHQRRQDFRAHIARSLFTRVEIDGVIGVLRDLSASGMSFEVATRCDMAVGQRFDGCRVQLGDDSPLTCSVEIRRVTPMNDGTTCIGAQFLGLPPDAMRWIRRSVMALERDQRRRAADTP